MQAFISDPGESLLLINNNIIIRYDKSDKCLSFIHFWFTIPGLAKRSRSFCLCQSLPLFLWVTAYAPIQTCISTSTTFFHYVLDISDSTPHIFDIDTCSQSSYYRMLIEEQRRVIFNASERIASWKIKKTITFCFCLLERLHNAGLRPESKINACKIWLVNKKICKNAMQFSAKPVDPDVCALNLQKK